MFNQIASSFRQRYGNLSPQQIYYNPDSKNYVQLLKNQISKKGGHRKIRQLVGTKIVSQFMKSHPQLTQEQSASIIYLDDFWSKIKDSKVFSFLRDAYTQNKDQIHQWLINGVSALNPLAGRITQKVLKTFGGDLKSQDPYAVDVNYLKAVFGLGPLYPAPRQDMHYMAKFMNTTQYTVTSSPAGTASIVVCPQSLFSPVPVGNPLAYYPYVNINNVNPLTPYANSIMSPGPFASQDSTTSLKAPDLCNVRFINTMNALTSSGKAIISVFYQPLDNAWFLPCNSAAVLFTEQGLLNNYGFVRQYSMQQLKSGKLISRYIMDQPQNLFSGLDPTANIPCETFCFIIIYFTGLPPSTVIGTMFVDTMGSAQPVPTQRGILPVQRRGSWQGTFRILRQLRHSGMQVQFDTPQQLSDYVHSNYKQLNFGSSVKRDLANYYKYYKVMFDPSANGDCVSQCLNYLGIINDLAQWATPQELKQYTSDFFFFEGQYVPITGRKILLDVITQHAVVVQPKFGASNCLQFTCQKFLKQNNLSFFQGQDHVVRLLQDKLILYSKEQQPIVSTFPVCFNQTVRRLQRILNKSQMSLRVQRVTEGQLHCQIGQLQYTSVALFQQYLEERQLQIKPIVNGLLSYVVQDGNIKTYSSGRLIYSQKYLSLQRISLFLGYQVFLEDGDIQKIPLDQYIKTTPNVQTNKVIQSGASQKAVSNKNSKQQKKILNLQAQLIEKQKQITNLKRSKVPGSSQKTESKSVKKDRKQRSDVQPLKNFDLVAEKNLAFLQRSVIHHGSQSAKTSQLRLQLNRMNLISKQMVYLKAQNFVHSLMFIGYRFTKKPSQYKQSLIKYLETTPDANLKFSNDQKFVYLQVGQDKVQVAGPITN